jgi:hypothetical protein
MNFLPTYHESPPKKGTTFEQVERKVNSDKPKRARSKKPEKENTILNLDWSGNGLASIDSLQLFPELLTLNLSENQIKKITPELKIWYAEFCKFLVRNSLF